MYPYILTDTALTVFTPGEILTMDRNNRKFCGAIEALKSEDMEYLLRLMKPVTVIVEATRYFPEFVIRDGRAYYRGEEMLGYAIDKLMVMVEDGLPIEPLVNFLRRLADNPSSRAVRDLYRFLEYGRLPLMPDGRFLAYKRIREDYTDVHTGKISNRVGETVWMPRNQVDDDPTQTCSHGLHVCSFEYLESFSGPICVAVAVDPSDVVAIPIDYNNTKMRVSKYTVMAEIAMPESYNHWNSEVVDEYDDEDDYEEEEEEEEVIYF